MKSFVILLSFITVIVIVSCNKSSDNSTKSETTAQIQAATEMSNALARMGQYNDSTAFHHGTPHAHHYDSIFHHYDSLYIHNHNVYHHTDTIHHPTSQHLPIHHFVHDSIVVAHLPHHP